MFGKPQVTTVEPVSLQSSVAELLFWVEGVAVFLFAVDITVFSINKKSVVRSWHSIS